MTLDPPAKMFSLHTILPYLTGTLAIISVTLAIRAVFASTHKRLPPGPKPLPLIGNLLDLPSSEEWRTWQLYVKRYGDLVYLSALGNQFLLLGSHEAITDLLEKRTSYNSRANLTMTGELMDNRSWNIGFLPYGSQWRLGRKIIHSQTHAIAAASYQPIQLRGARRFVSDLLAAESLRPYDKLSEAAKSVLPRLIRQNFTFTTVNMLYGIDVCDPIAEARYVDVPEKVLRIVSEGLTPGRFLVDFLPILKYVPAWFPGANFQRFAFEGKALGKQMRDDPMVVVKAQLAAGRTPESMAAHMLMAFPQDEQVVSDMAGATYLAGSDTTVAAVTSFFLAMTIYPSIQWKAQQELDRVVGRARLPEFSDKDNLPYLQAVMRECVRWLPVAPQGLAHFTEQDDEYRGFFIPKNTIVLPFQWGILHDENTFPQPSDFMPERYLTRRSDDTWELRTDVVDPRSYAFGFGRRVCPGKHIAEQSLFATLSTVIHTLDVIRAKDSLGQEVVPDARMNSGLLCHPIPFAYELRIRKDAQHLVEMCAAAMSSED